MVKKCNGIELLELLKEDKIPYGTKVYMEQNINTNYKFYTIIGGFRALQIWREEEGKEDVLINRVIDTEDLLNSTFYITEEDRYMSLEETKEILENLSKEMEDVYCKTKINNTRERNALKSILNIINESLIIPKKDLQDIKEKKIKENSINEDYGIESRAYLMNLGKISLCEVLEYKYGGNIENE